MILTEIVRRNDEDVVRYEAHERQVGFLLEPAEMELGTRQRATSKFTFAPGDLFFTPRREDVWIRGQDAQFMVTTLSQAAFEGAIGSRASAMLKCQKHMRDPRLRGLLSCLHAEHVAGFPSGRILLDSIDLAIATVLSGKSTALSSAYKFGKGFTPRKLRQITEFIHANLDRDLSLNQLCEFAGLSASHFTQMFRGATGIPPHRFLLKTRLERARELLLESDDGVLDVAISCGFKTSQHFAKAFRDHWKMSPSQYRSNYQRI